jgi:glucose/arabinose dehydrogenase
MRTSTRLRLERLEDREVPTVIPGFTESVFASGLVQPTAMAVAPDGRIFVAQKGGALRVVQNGTALATPFLTVSVDTTSERGLVGVALDPSFTVNGFVYIYYTASGTTPVNRVSRFVANPLNPNVALAGETILVNNIPSTNGNHNGGALQFAPDGTLFVGIGDAGVAANAQDVNTLAGKILRINPTNGSAAAGNPPVSAMFPQIWALGLRNPFTMAFQPGTGRLFINDVGSSGPNAFEEVNEGVAGANYGWPQTEGPNPPGVVGVTYPIYAYPHGTGPLQGDSIAGGAFYNPATVSFPSSFAGDYFFGDFVRSRIFVRDADTGTVSTLAPQTAGAGVVDLDVLPDGRLLYLSINTGTIYQIAAAPPAATTSGQITAVGTAPGVIPLVAALNPDGTTRFTALVFPNYVGVRVATGDVTGDGVEDLIATSGPGGPPLVTVYDGRNGQPINAFFALDAQFRLGLNVAAGDVTGDGRAEIIVGTATGTSFVMVLDGLTGQTIRSFFAFPGFAGGVTVAAGDVDGDGRADIIAGAASGISAVTVFSGTTGSQLRTFLAFGTAPIGVNVGYANGDILTGTITGAPVVATYTSTGLLRLFFVAGSAAIPGGARVTGMGDQIIAGVGPALLTYDRLTGTLQKVRFAFDFAIPGNVFVG